MDSTKIGGVAGAENLKLQQHLVLLKEEYVKLQLTHYELEKKYALLSPSHGDNENNFVSQLVKIISGLYDNSLFSDIQIKMKDRTVPAHRFVLAARSSAWCGQTLADEKYLDWCKMEQNVCLALLNWIYTDEITFDYDDDFILKLMRYANTFMLVGLVSKCERALIASVGLKNCVQFYTTADEIKAEELKKHCSELISVHWDDFTSEDFAHMSAPLLYQMFKTKSQYPLHSSVRLKREDVVFLYLVENNSQLTTKLNSLDSKGDLPLDLALRTNQNSIAKTLIEHGADPNATDANSWTLLYKALDRGDGYAANFLLQHNADVTRITVDRGDSYLHLIASCSPDSTSEETSTAMTAIAKVLLERGLNPNLQNNQGFTALHLAVMARNEDIFDLLLSNNSIVQNINLNLTTNEGHTPLWYALISSRLCNPNSFAARLVEKGASPNPIYPKTQNSLLHLVAEEGLEDAGLFLCSHIQNFDYIYNTVGESALHIACRRDQPRLVTRLLECGANPNLQTLPPNNIDLDDESIVYRQTPLHVAIRSCCNASVKAILNYKASIDEASGMATANLNLRDSRGDSPLSLALNNGMQHLVTDLIKEGADLNMRNGEGLTLLHIAIRNKDSETAIFLLQHGAHMEAKTTDGLTPLHLSIKYQLGPVVEALCRRGVDMSEVDEHKNCPLWAALDSEQEDIASILVRHGVDTDCWSEGPDGCIQTLLHRAIDENKQNIATFLIKSGCDHSVPRKPGLDGRGGDEAKDQMTPLHLCCQWGLDSVVHELIEHGANVNTKDVEGKTPLHIAIQNQHPYIISLLLYHPNLDLTLRDKAGLTPFAMALACHNDKAARAIRDKLPTAAEQFDSKGRNFLHMAIQKHDVESVLFLLSLNVDVNSKVQDLSQTSSLHLAAQSGDEMLLRSLILAGARIDDRDAHHRTALHVAAEAGFTSIVTALLGNNADFNAVDAEGDNSLHIAVREGNLAVVRTLLTESSLDAEAVNLKGRNPLHVLARYARDNAATICDLFLECMPHYPLDKPDLEGNTALILAYMKGNGNLCRTLVKAGASLGAMNKDRVTIFNYQVATKTLLKRLLDHLSQEPPWVEGDMCLECGSKFGLTQRKHHCRHCGRLLCSKCSGQEMPILKFNLNKPVRVCTICFDVLQIGLT